jgi:ribosomal 30S subunit maturation factor RimM
MVGRTIYADVEMEDEQELDFTGWTILDRGTRIGTCTGIEPIPGNPCLYVKLADGSEPLIPLHEDFIAGIDEASRTLSLNLPEGLY